MFDEGLETLSASATVAHTKKQSESQLTRSVGYYTPIFSWNTLSIRSALCFRIRSVTWP